jgi:hypothetical protein
MPVGQGPPMRRGEHFSVLWIGTAPGGQCHNYSPVVAPCAGKYAETEQMQRKVLKARQHMLGREHLDTLTSIEYLAGTLSAQGKHHLGNSSQPIF